jgi:uncharacterized membrane protein
MGFFAMMFLFFVFMRMMHGRRRHFARLHYYGAHRYYNHHLHARHFAAMADAPRPNAYEQLKQRYVRGDIDVEEYERGVDEILRSPEGQRIVN